MKTLLTLLIVGLFFAAPAQAQIVAPISSFTVAVTTSEGSVGWPFTSFACCVNGAGGVSFDCGQTISATKGLVRQGQCIDFKRATSCGTLHWIGAAASTLDCFATK